MERRIVLIIDATINFLLGVLLLAFNEKLVGFLGVPPTDTNFYANILGAIFIGITLALLLEAFRSKESSLVGLGTGGAICINLCGGIVLTLWLLFGNLSLPLKGEIFLWILAFSLILVSSAELFFSLKKSNHRIH